MSDPTTQTPANPDPVFLFEQCRDLFKSLDHAVRNGSFDVVDARGAALLHEIYVTKLLLDNYFKTRTSQPIQILKPAEPIDNGN